jgi:hypothetical protein
LKKEKGKFEEWKITTLCVISLEPIYAIITYSWGQVELIKALMNVDIKRITRLKMQITQKLFNDKRASTLDEYLKPYIAKGRNPSINGDMIYLY